jgi:hypothetical protein
LSNQSAQDGAGIVKFIPLIRRADKVDDEGSQGCRVRNDFAVDGQDC